MRTLTLLALGGTLILTACGDKADDSGGTAAGDDTGTGDGGTTADCNSKNEDCAPGTCNGEGGTMLPGSACISCHSPGNYDEEEGNAFWSAAGTVYSDHLGTSGASSVTIRVTDANGITEEMTSNGVGNFYTKTALTPPLTAEVEAGGSILQMAAEVDTGDCSTCHSCVGSAGGKLYSP